MIKNLIQLLILIIIGLLLGYVTEKFIFLILNKISIIKDSKNEKTS